MAAFDTSHNLEAIYPLLAESENGAARPYFTVNYGLRVTV
jgi:hypothetical protein